MTGFPQKLYRFVEAKIQRQGDKLWVFGVATSEAIDSYGTIFTMDATREAVKEYSQWRNLRAMHDIKAIGTVPIIELTDDKMLIGALIVDTDEIKKWEEGIYKGFSIGANPFDGYSRTVNGKNVWVVTKYQLAEISCADRPSNPEAVKTIMMRNEYNLADKEAGWTFDWKDDADAIINKFGWDGMKTACLYYDKNNSETKSGYKLPVMKLAKPDDDKLTLFFYGVVAAMGALNGARGKMDLPQPEREKIYQKIKKLYDLFGETAPELKPMEVRKMDEKQIEQEVEKGIIAFFKRVFSGKESAPPSPEPPTPARPMLTRIVVPEQTLEQAKALRAAIADKADKETLNVLDAAIARMDAVKEEPKAEQIIKALEERIQKVEAENQNLLTTLNEALTKRQSADKVSQNQQPKSPYGGVFIR